MTLPPSAATARRHCAAVPSSGRTVRPGDDSPMATIEECRTALDQLARNMAGAGSDMRAATALDRSLSCRITDLDVTFAGRLAGGTITDVVAAPGTPDDKA